MQENFDHYNEALYKKDIDNFGLNGTWDGILNFIKSYNVDNIVLKPENLGELYEIGLAYVNKRDKKECGKYYTPDDVASVMSSWLSENECVNICDVCCGTGNLILSYLDTVGRKAAEDLLAQNRVFLYDIDGTALNICKTIIEMKYAAQIAPQNIITGDFLDKNIRLPENSAVISNPPYFKITKIEGSWEITPNITESREFYSAIMEKILDESRFSVVITPFGFISGRKFKYLREKMAHRSGFIVSFDNVPANVFNGRKHGIFNTNTSNSVRAAITVSENKPGVSGYRVSPLIRFKASERNLLMKPDVLRGFLGAEYQEIGAGNDVFVKCEPDLYPLFLQLKECRTLFRDSIGAGGDPIYVPTTCRYFVTGAKRNLKRDGKYVFQVKKDYTFCYCLLNSSFPYWYWRMYDGGITLQHTLVLDLPIFADMLSEEDNLHLEEIAKEMQTEEEKYLIYKKNANKIQENIKFPDSYRKKINKIFIKALGSPVSAENFEKLYYNEVFKPAV
ncbi:MAG: SAM-dependent DNA methyltransferase [Synergistes sp.]|nr:SAM-dependent DNA methyltransferase [Synergistes sp.]